MTKFTRETDSFVAKLITAVSGFEEGSKNFTACRQFTSSNLKYHKFLGVDSNNVDRSIQGLLEKFEVHSQQSKAASFSYLTETFLKRPVLVKDDRGAKSDTHYAVLSLLLELSSNVITTDFKPSPRVEQKVEEETFDWGSYLQEGLWDYKEPFSDSSDSDWDDEDDEVQTVVTKPSPSQQKPTELTHTADAVAQPNQVLENEAKEGSAWLVSNLQPRYWIGEPVNVSAGPYLHSQLNSLWQRERVIRADVISQPKQLILTEDHIVRECLWILQGQHETHVFCGTAQGFVMIDNVAVTHLTPGALRSAVREICRYASIMHALQAFVSWTPDEDEDELPLTYEAFAAGIRDVLHTIRERLVELEKSCTTQDPGSTPHLTLLGLKAALHRDMYPTLPLLARVLERGVVPPRVRVTNCVRSTRLLDTLFSELLDANILGLPEKTLRFLLSLWLRTLKPYIELIDEWIHRGSLIDTREEFILQRNETDVTRTEEFWEKSFVARSPDKHPSRSTSSRASRPTTEGSNVSLPAPRFLSSVIQQVILAGKSMEVLKSLGELDDLVYKSASSTGVELFEGFLNELEKMLENTDNSIINSCEPQPNQFLQDTRRRAGDMLKLCGLNSALLDLSLDAALNSSIQARHRKRAACDRLHSRLRSLDAGSVLVSERRLQDCVFPAVIRRCEHVCLRLAKLMTEKYELHTHLSNIRNLFLMESGDIMYNFYTEIFHKMDNREPWRDKRYLNELLNEALVDRLPDLINKVKVSVQSKPEGQSSITANYSLSGLLITYDVPFPACVIITSDSRAIYNKILCFLLELKLAKFCLDGLRFNDLSSETRQATNRRLQHKYQVFRSHLMHFVNCLNSYIMTRILHSTGLEFAARLSEARDLESLVSAHARYVSLLHERCLLHRKLGLIRESISRILGQCFRFHGTWKRGIRSDTGALREDVLQEIESDFSSCIQFLSSFLNNVIKRGSFPHLESLANELSSAHLFSQKLHESTDSVIH